MRTYTKESIKELRAYKKLAEYCKANNLVLNITENPVAKVVKKPTNSNNREIDYIDKYMPNTFDVKDDCFYPYRRRIHNLYCGGWYHLVDVYRGFGIYEIEKDGSLSKWRSVIILFKDKEAVMLEDNNRHYLYENDDKVKDQIDMRVDRGHYTLRDIGYEKLVPKDYCSDGSRTIEGTDIERIYKAKDRF